LVEVVRFFVTYGLARNKTGSVKDGITELYQKKNNIAHKMDKNFVVFISHIYKNN
jgi:predicted  nucleic acid-binding Zn-ribbon protein